jgi:hypothetical protein
VRRTWLYAATTCRVRCNSDHSCGYWKADVFVDLFPKYICSSNRAWTREIPRGAGLTAIFQQPARQARREAQYKRAKEVISDHDPTSPRVGFFVNSTKILCVPLLIIHLLGFYVPQSELRISKVSPSPHPRVTPSGYPSLEMRSPFQPNSAKRTKFILGMLTSNACPCTGELSRIKG